MSHAMPELQAVMEDAVDECITHIDRGGLPFVGVVANNTGVISGFGVNRVRETGDPNAHAEIVAMRDAMASQGLENLAAPRRLPPVSPVASAIASPSELLESLVADPQPGKGAKLLLKRGRRQWTNPSK